MNEFEQIYKNDAWGFGSGHGSLPSVTKGYRDFLQTFIDLNNIKNVVDYGFGDWQFTKFINWDRVQYTGFETVRSLVETNTKQYDAKNIKFKLTPDNMNDLPAADLIIVKDVLQHLKTADIKKFIKVALPKYKYALITNNFVPRDQLNIEIETGSFRPLDLRLSPYTLKATAVYKFGRPKRTYSFRHRKFFDPWEEVVLMVVNEKK